MLVLAVILLRASFAVQAALAPDNNIQQGDYIQLQVMNDACNNNLSPFLIASGDKMLTSEVEDKAFKITWLSGDRFQLKSETNGYWVAANNWGNARVIVSKTTPVNPGWETFVFEKIGSGQIRIRTADQSIVYYWSANTVRHHSPAVIANVTKPGNCETFNVYRCQKVYDGYCTPSVSDRYWGTVFRNYDVSNGEWLATRDAELDQICAAHCHGFAGCTAWARQPSLKKANCFLTKGATGYKKAADRNAGPGANFWHWQAWDETYAVPTFKDSVQTGITTENACSNRCSMNSGCIAWSRDMTTDTCYLYRDVDYRVGEENFHCGLRSLPVAPIFDNNDNSLDTGSIINIQSSNGLWWRIDRQDKAGVVQLVENINPYDSQYQFMVENVEGDKVMIQSKANDLWLRVNLTTYSVRFSAKYPGDTETWSVERLTLHGHNKQQVQLKTSDGRRWMTLSDSPKNEVGQCSSSKLGYPDSCTSIAALVSEDPGRLESFSILLPPDPTPRLTADNSLISGEYYQIQASNGLWWQVEDNTGIVKLMRGSNPNEAGRWFLINNWGTGEIQIQSRKTGLWLRANNNGGSNVRFGASIASSWEAFYYKQLTDGENKQIRLKTNGGAFWVTLASSYLNDLEPCSSFEQCTSINALKSGEPGEWETFNVFTYTALVGNNLGSWLLLEGWMNSDVYVDGNYRGVQLKTASAQDEWTWSELQTQFSGSRSNGVKGRAVHWDNHITDRDFQWMAAHKINVVRIPVGYWLTLSEEELVKHGFPFYPGGVAYLDRAFEVAASYGIWVIISMHGAYGSQNGNDHSGHKGAVAFGSGTTVEDTANFVKTLATRYAHWPNFYGIGVINEPYIWEGNIPIPTLHEYLTLSSGYLRTAAPFAMAFIPDAFQQDKVHEFAPPFTGSQVLEAHPYRGYDSSPGNLEEQMNRIRNDIYNLDYNGKRINYWTFVGECSNGANPDVFKDMTEGETFYAHRRYGTTQADGYGRKAITLGYTFWPYKITGEKYYWNDWCFRQSIEEQTWPDLYVRT